MAELSPPRYADAALPRPARAALEDRRADRRRAIDELERRWPGLRDRICEPGPALRPHIHVLRRPRAAELETPIDERSEVHVVAAISGG
jgi:hypothetical protein